MRHMPSFYDSQSVDGVIEIPSTTQWDELVLSLIGRPVTTGEESRIINMKKHNWTARVAAEDIIGRDLTSEEVEERMIEL